MPVKVDICDNEDIDRVFSIMSETFKHDEPYIDTVYPKHETAAGHVQGRDRMLEQKTSDPTVRYIKATDLDTGKIIGQANWLCLDKDTVKDHLEGDFWPTEDDKEFAYQLYAQFVVYRCDAIRSANGPVWILDLLAVDPKHQNGGAGSKLISWGLEQGDKMGVEALVESTMGAKRVYEKNGFEQVQEIEMAFSEKHAHRPKPRLIFMRRPAKAAE